MSKTIRHERTDDRAAARYVRSSRAAALAEARDYYALLTVARSVGVPTSLDDRRSPRTVAGLRAATAKAVRASLDTPTQFGARAA